MSAPTVSLDAITPRPIEWLWREHIPVGMIVGIVGRPDHGKSVLTLHVAADVSHEANVLISTSENALETVSGPRGMAAVEAAGGNVDRVHFERHRLPALPVGLPTWKQRIQDLNLKLIVLDPVASHLTPHIGDDQGVRTALDPLADLCASSECSVLLVTHPIKNLPRSAEPLAAMGGAAGGLAGQCRVVYLFGRAPDDADARALAQAKCNIAAARPSLSFEMDLADVDGIEAPLLRFHGICETTARQLIDVGREQAKHAPTKEEAAAEWLTRYLFASGEPYERLAREIKEDAEQQQISYMTLRRASEALGIEKPKGGRNSRWRLPAEMVEFLRDQEAQSSDDGEAFEDGEDG